MNVWKHGFFLNNREHGLHSFWTGDNVDIVQECQDVFTVEQVFLDRLQCLLLPEEQWHHRVPMLTTFLLRNSVRCSRIVLSQTI